MNPAPVLLTASEVAEILRLDLKTVRLHTRRGDYPFARNISATTRPKWRYDSRAMQRWLDACAAA